MNTSFSTRTINQAIKAKASVRWMSGQVVAAKRIGGGLCVKIAAGSDSIFAEDRGTRKWWSVGQTPVVIE